MRPASIALIAAACVAAIGAVIAANRFVQSQAAAAAAQNDMAKRDVEVLVAARDIPQGRVLRELDLGWEKWPILIADPARVTVRREGKTNLAHLEAAATRRPLLKGEPITRHALFTPGKGAGFMTGMITPGKKAVGITVTAASSASGFVLPGDLVDVILTVDMNKAQANLPDVGRFAARTLLQQVRVLAVDQALNSGGSAGKKKAVAKAAKVDADKSDPSSEPEEVAIVGKTVAIEVTPMEAELVLAAQSTGTLSLSLRSLAVSDEETGKASQPIPEVKGGFRSATGDGIRLIKGGEVAH